VNAFLLQLVELLLQHGADQHLKNSRGVTSRAIAGPQVLDLFLKYPDQQPPVSQEKTPTEGECDHIDLFHSFISLPTGMPKGQVKDFLEFGLPPNLKCLQSSRIPSSQLRFLSFINSKFIFLPANVFLLYIRFFISFCIIVSILIWKIRQIFYTLAFLLGRRTAFF